MAKVTLDLSDVSPTSFAALIASRVPIGFLNAVRPAVAGSYDQAFKGTPLKDGDLPYILNLIPHDRNRRSLEQIHELAVTFDMTATPKMLSNGYYYLEIVSKGLVLHVKHFNNYQSLKEQITKADYRREMTAMNHALGQLPLFNDGPVPPIPEEIYAILFFEDNMAKRSEVEKIYFILPSDSEGFTLGYAKIEDVIASSMTMEKPESAKRAVDDSIDLPSKRKSDEQEEAK